jgi:L-threonylcarbamoyladenylate synthase
VNVRTRVVPFETAAQRARSAGRVAAHLRRGGLIAYPTETVYGFGCALLPAPLRRLWSLKRRGDGKPFLVLVSSARALPFLRWTGAARVLARTFWPGPLTLALRADARAVAAGRVPSEILSDGGAVAVRRSPHPAVRAILAALGGPVTSTSANVAGEAPARDAAAALRAVESLAAVQRFLLLDGGMLPPSEPSTVVDCSGARPRLVRRGALDLDTLRRTAPEIDA